MKPQELAVVTAFHPNWNLRQRGEFFGVTRQAVHDMLNRGCKRKDRDRTQAQVTLREMSDIEAAYVGALIDTDGCVPHVAGRYWHILFNNTEVELVSNALRLTGIGKISYRPIGGHYKDIWKWGVYRREDVAALMKRLKPYSLKIQRALDKIDVQPP